MGGSHQARKLAVNIYKFRSYTAYHWFGMIKSFKHLARITCTASSSCCRRRQILHARIDMHMTLAIQCADDVNNSCDRHMRLSTPTQLPFVSTNRQTQPWSCGVVLLDRRTGTCRRLLYICTSCRRQPQPDREQESTCMHGVPEELSTPAFARAIDRQASN